MEDAVAKCVTKKTPKEETAKQIRVSPQAKKDAGICLPVIILEKVGGEDSKVGGWGGRKSSLSPERKGVCEYSHRLKISLKQLDKLTGTGCTMLQKTISG